LKKSIQMKKKIWLQKILRRIAVVVHQRMLM